MKISLIQCFRKATVVSSMGIFAKTKVVLIDLSGTIHIDDAEIPGSIEALNRLRKQQNLKLKFVTNTTKESKRILTERLTKIGFNILPGDIFTSLTAARNLIDKEKLSPLLMLDDRALEEFEGFSKDNKDSVLIGLAPDQFNYEKMNEAFRLLLSGACLIAIHKARYFKQKEGLSLGPGPFVSALEFATDRPAVVVGKPETSFFLSAVLEFGESPANCVMIGDDTRDDVCGAINAGMSGILVQTGKYRQGDEKYLPENGQVVTNFSEAVNLILKDIESY